MTIGSNFLAEVMPENLVTEVLKLQHKGYRLIQICATGTKEGYELTYSFGKEYEFYCLRMNIAPDTEIVSISNIYGPAFLYENEIHDLFGINIKLMTVDYHGNLYRIKEKTPYKHD